MGKYYYFSYAWNDSFGNQCTTHDVIDKHPVEWLLGCLNSPDEKIRKENYRILLITEISKEQYDKLYQEI